MKRSLAYFIMFTLTFILNSQNLLAFEKNIFNESYPSFDNYQSILFSKFKNYFSALALNSLNYQDINGIKIFKIKSGDNFLTLYSKITRSRLGNKLTESIVYSLENGNSLEYIIEKIGDSVEITNDLDLLSFQFKKSSNEQFYKIIIPTFKVYLTYAHTAESETNFFSLGYMDFNVKIETLIKEKSAQRNYLFFLKNMPNPQSSLTVVAEENFKWGNVEYRHIFNNSEEITPKQFFQGLAMGIEPFEEASDIFIKTINSLNFPVLN